LRHKQVLILRGSRYGDWILNFGVGANAMYEMVLDARHISTRWATATSNASVSRLPPSL
jgi:hypothetical protein